jgi:surface polysaccharide O-acyltransferase-like enzyme
VFAIVTVVAIHTLMPYREILPPTAPVRIFDDLLHYAVPLFVFISGVFVWGRPWHPSPGAYRRFLARRAGVIVVPYLGWSAFYLALLAWQGAEPPLSAGRVLGLLLTGHTWYHLYFIPMLVTFYLLTPVAARIAERSPELLLLGCYALRILAGPEIAEVARGVLGDMGWSFATHVMTHLPHMALGAWFAWRQDRVPRRAMLALVLLASGTAVLYAASVGATAELPLLARRLVFPIGMAATVIGMAVGALVLEPLLERRTALIVGASALAFGVYFVHPALLLGVDELVAALSAEQLWLQPWFPLAVFASVTAASFGISAALARVPVACRLVGISGSGGPRAQQRTR